MRAGKTPMEQTTRKGFAFTLEQFLKMARRYPEKPRDRSNRDERITGRE
jgi:hypothetical protein